MLPAKAGLLARGAHWALLFSRRCPQLSDCRVAVAVGFGGPVRTVG